MSLDTHLGRRTNLLRPCAHVAGTLHLNSPILNEAELDSLNGIDGRFSSQTLSLSYDASSGLDAAPKQALQ